MDGAENKAELIIQIKDETTFRTGGTTNDGFLEEAVNLMRESSVLFEEAVDWTSAG